MEEIKNLSSYVKPFLPPGVKVAKSTINNLIPPGENYGSILLAVDLLLTNNEELHLVAKKCPSNEFIRKMFNVDVTFRKEAELYNIIVPIMNYFLKQNGCAGMDVFPKFYGSRFEANVDTGSIDNDSYFLLENVKQNNFKMHDRMEGFNFDCTKFIVEKLAEFHAVPVAIKIREPEVFEQHILPTASKRTMIEDTFPFEMVQRINNELLTILKEVDRFKPYMDSILSMIETYKNYYRVDTDVVEPFASLMHSDFWTNNMMLKLNPDGKITSIRFLDFQMLLYGNFVVDLVFFLFSSVQISVLKQHYDDLLNIYYDKFIQTLKDLHVDNLKEFGKYLFHSEIDRCMKRMEMHHSLFMLSPIFTNKEKASDLSNVDSDSMLSKSKLNNEKYTEKLLFLIDFFIDKGWL